MEYPLDIQGINKEFKVKEKEVQNVIIDLRV